MPVPTDGSHSILYLNYSLSRSGSEPNVKDGVAAELLEDGSEPVRCGRGQVSDHAHVNADQDRHPLELLYIDAIRDLHTPLTGCVF